MSNNKVKIKIIINNHESETNSKERFWNVIDSNSILKSKGNENNPAILEYNFKKNFPKILKNKLRNEFQNGLKAFEEGYDSGLKNYINEFLSYSQINNKNEGDFSDLFTGIARLQELKNEYFKDNYQYAELLNKNSLSSQVYFGIENITYSSISFDLSIEPIEKIINLFDNNFEYFYIFLNSYISDCFTGSLPTNNNKLLFSSSVEYSSEFKSMFDKKDEDTIEYPQQIKEIHNTTTKLEKAKWVWSLTNGSLFFPVALSLGVLYIAFDNITNLADLHKQHYESIEKENANLIQSYNKLIEIQQKAYDDLIQKGKNDNSAKKK